MSFSKLSDCEMMTICCIWWAHKDLSISEIRETMKKRFGKEYERSTVCTFVRRLEGKGYVCSCQNNRNAAFLYHPLVKEEAFLCNTAKQFLNLWFSGSLPEFISSFCEKERISQRDIQKLRRIIDGMDC